MSDTKILLIAYIQGLSDSDCEKLWNFLNSEAPIETPNVNNNEAQEKDCNSCEHRWMPITDCCRCSYLNNYEYWKQSD